MNKIPPSPPWLKGGEMEAWVLEYSAEQQAFHLRPEAERPGPGDWEILSHGTQITMEALARILADFWWLGEPECIEIPMLPRNGWH